MTRTGRIEKRLARLYERLGARYLSRGWALAWVLFLISGVCAAALARPYTDASLAETAGLLAVIEAGLVLMMLFGGRVRRRQQNAFEEWWRDGRPSAGAAAVWDALVPLPVLWSSVGWPTGIVVVGVPTTIYVTAVLGLGAGEGATVFAGVAAAGGYAALVGSFTVELYLRPALRDAASRKPPGALPARVRVPIARRLFAALLMTSGSTGFFVAMGMSVGDGSLDDLALGLALTVGVTFTAALVCTVIVTGSTAGPVADLLRATRRIREGDAGARVPVVSEDEFGVLAASFNEMTEELQRSRARIVAAGDAERRRVERNIHDGAQQRLVALSLDLRMLEDALSEDGRADLQAMAADAAGTLSAALDELRELARGLHPSVLASDGLRPALEQAVARAPVPVEVAVPPERFPQLVEATAYFVACEALANVAKHADASRAEISVAQRNGRLVVEVSDDGVGGADAAAGSGLEGLRDRVAALGGRLSIESPPGAGTRLVAELPVDSGT